MLAIFLLVATVWIFKMKSRSSSYLTHKKLVSAQAEFYETNFS